MENERHIPKRPWDSCRDVPVIQDEQTPWKLVKLLKFLSLCALALLVFGLAVSSKVSFLLLITLSNKATLTIPDDQKPVALLCVGCALISSSVLLLLKSIWKANFKTSKLPAKVTAAVVLLIEFLVSLGSAVLTIVAMPHLDIVSNVTILNSVAVLSAVLQIAAQCIARERNRFLLPSIFAFVLILLGYSLFLVFYLLDENRNEMAIWAGLAVAGSFLTSFNWWENYIRLFTDNSSSNFLSVLSKDIRRCRNMLHILSSLVRILVTGCVLGAYVPLSKRDWTILTTIPHRETRTIVILIGVQLISSALCHWFAVAACKMHALRRSFILPLYFASLAVMAVFIAPVFIYYQDYRTNLNVTDNSTFTDYCTVAVYGRNQTLEGSTFPHLVLDVTHTLCSRDLSQIIDIGLLTGLAVAWWLGLLLATLHLWFLKLQRIQRTQDLFIRRMYEGAFIEQSLLLNTRFDIQMSDRKKYVKSIDPVTVYLCATMWHETYTEMMQIIFSVFRLDKYRPKKDPKDTDVIFETHIFFDDAFKDVPGSLGRHINEYAETLVETIREVYSIFMGDDRSLFRMQQQIPDQNILRTPYGGRLEVTMPHGNKLVVHFKDKQLIRHKKRWSQVMYLYYLLGWRLMTKYYISWVNGEEEAELKTKIEKEKHNTYLLALDGDTGFQPAAVMLLIDRLKLYPLVGAACGRIHPTGSGPMVWFQKFEYAIGHWLQKTAEHVFGCVLCSPGCFSLFRAAALMDNNVMKRYSTKSLEARHYIQYDQGEDRWLCTLLLKQGWRVEYNAASDAYTNAPEEFNEFYNQRRRWGPSTMANIVDLLGSTNMISKRNRSVSKLYMLYHLFGITSSILGPATICLMIAGSFTFMFNFHPSGALILAVIPPAIYLGLCFKLKSDTQILIAAVMSVGYAFFMLVVVMSIIGTMVKDKTILTPSSIFIIAMAILYVITATMHPQEFFLVFYGFLYILCIPSAYLLLAIYSMVNMNNVSWGTRETMPAAGAATPAAPPQTRVQKARGALEWLLLQARCCKNPCQKGSREEVSISQENLISEVVQPVPRPQNTVVEDVGSTVEEQRQEEPPFICPNQCWVSQLQSMSDDMYLQEATLDKDEEEFWRELQTKYLEPLPEDKKKQKKITNDLRELRNKITFVYFICNALWLVATFTLQLFEATFTIRLPKVDLDLEFTGEYIAIDPVSFMFILGYAVLVVVQFVAMLYHRIYTLIHFVAFVDTESKAAKQVPDPEIDDDDDDDDSDEVFFPNLYFRSEDGGTLV